MATRTQIKRRGRLGLILGIIVAAVAFAAVAVADVVTVNDVITGGDTSLTRSDAGTAGVSIQASNTVPVGDGGSGCNATGANPATVTLNSNSANVTVNAPTSNSYSGCASVETFGYSVASTAALGSLTTLSTATTGGKSGSLYQEDSFTVRILPRPASNLAAAENGATQIDLSWTASPDAADITDYKIYEGATEVATATNAATSKAIVGLAPGSSHCYTIKARYNDGSDNWFSAAAGGSGAACATTVSDSTAPVITKVVSGTMGDNGWYTSNVTVTWTVTDGESAVVIDSGCGVQNFTTETTGVTSSCSAHSAGGSASDSVTLKIDKTGPSATLAVTAGTAGTNGWYTSDVTVGTSGSDSISGPASCTAAQSQTTETAGTAFNGSCTNQAGLTTSALPLTVKLDKTGPTASLAVTAGTLGSNGWYKSDVTVSTSGADTISSPVTCSADQFQTTETAGTTFSGSCTNDAGLTTNAAALTVKLDKTAPGLSWSGSINDGDSFYFGSVPAAPTCTASDDLSGPDGCNVTGYSTAVGSHTLTATAKDKAGHQTVETRTYTVLAWTLNGFYQPVDMSTSSTTMWNTVKNGSTVPLKFNVFAGSTELTNTSAIKPLTYIGVTCSVGDPADEIELTATGGTSLRYDSAGGQFVYNWQTPKKAGACYKVTMETLDGSKLEAYFKLK